MYTYISTRYCIRYLFWFHYMAKTNVFPMKRTIALHVDKGTSSRDPDLRDSCRETRQHGGAHPGIPGVHMFQAPKKWRYDSHPNTT